MTAIKKLTSRRVAYPQLVAALQFRGTLCGTRRSIQKGPSDYRVVCATSGCGGTVRYRTAEEASAVAVRDSARACRTCGAV